MPMDDSEEARGRDDHERDERTDDRSMDGRREQHQLLHSTESNDFIESDAKRFCESKPRGADRYSMEGEKRFVEADSPMKRFVEPGSRVLSYPHSMPASPTMMDGRNHASLSLLRYTLCTIHTQSVSGINFGFAVLKIDATSLNSVFHGHAQIQIIKYKCAVGTLPEWGVGSRWRWSRGRRTTTPSTTGSRRTPMR